MTDFDRRVERTGAGEDAPLSDAERSAWQRVEASNRSFQQQLTCCEYSQVGARVPLGPCALCALPALHDMGIESVKIVGREAGLYRKLRSVQLVRAVLDRVRAGDAPREVKALAMHLRGDPAGCQLGYRCYYREARDLELLAGSSPAPPASPLS
jgi:putative protease